MDLLGKQIKIVEGEKVTMGTVQKLFPSGTDTVVNVKLATGGLKCYNHSEIFEDSDGQLTIVIQVVQPTVQPKKKGGLFGLFKK